MYKKTYPFLFAVYLFGYLLLHFNFFLGESSDEDFSLFSLVLSAVLCLSVAVYPMPGRDWFATPRLLAFLFLFFFPLYSLAYLWNPNLTKWYLGYFSSLDFSSELANATFHTVISLPIFLYGFLFGSKWFRKARNSGSINHYSLVVWIAYLSIVLAVMAMLAYARSIGGVAVVLDQMQSIFFRKSWSGASGYYYLGMLLLTAPAIVALLSVHDKKGPLIISLAIIAMVLSSGVLMVTQASREKAIFPLILFISTLVILSRSDRLRNIALRARSIAFLALFLLVSAFVIQSLFRSGGSDIIDQSTKIIRDFNRLDVSMVMFGEYRRAGNNYLLGKPFLSYPNQLIVWVFGTEPILNASAILNQFIFRGNLNAGNPGTPFAGELFLNFGYLGYIIFWIFGFYFGKLHAKLLYANFEFWHALFYSASTYFFVFKMCIYTGLSESVLMMAMVYFQLFIWKMLSRVSIRNRMKQMKIS